MRKRFLSSRCRSTVCCRHHMHARVRRLPAVRRSCLRRPGGTASLSTSAPGWWPQTGWPGCTPLQHPRAAAPGRWRRRPQGAGRRGSGRGPGAPRAPSGTGGARETARQEKTALNEQGAPRGAHACAGSAWGAGSGGGGDAACCWRACVALLGSSRASIRAVPPPGARGACVRARPHSMLHNVLCSMPPSLFRFAVRVVIRHVARWLPPAGGHPGPGPA